MRLALAAALAAVAVAGCGHLSAPAEPSDAELVKIARAFAARRPEPHDPSAGAKVEIERKPDEWIVWFVRELPPNTIGGDSVSYVIDRKTRRVTSVGFTQ